MRNCKICNAPISPDLPKQTRLCSPECRKESKRLNSYKYFSERKDDPVFKERLRKASEKYNTANREERNKYSRDRQRTLREDPTYVENLNRKRRERNLNPKIREAKRESDRRYYQQNKEKVKTAVVDYKRKNQAKVKTWTGSRKHRVKRASPPWLTKEQYDEMSRLYSSRKEGEQVDHIIPIKGKTVCGLHVPWNLRIITAEENQRKGRSENEDISSVYKNRSSIKGVK